MMMTLDDLTFNLTNWDEAKPRLKARLYNNSFEADVYEPAARYGFHDLRIVPYITMMENGYTKVTRQLTDIWGVTPEEVLEVAKANVADDVDIMSMAKLISELTDTPLPEGVIPTKVITNADKFYGAISIIYSKEKLSKMFPNGYIVLPSSVHEVIVIPDIGEDDNEKFVEMVRDVNATVVEPQDVLSDRIYTF